MELLDLQNTAFTTEGVSLLFQSLLSNQALRTLYLDGNGLGVECAFPIAAYFNALVDSAKVGLTRLWLSMNRLGDVGVSVILRALKDYLPLEGICVGSNGCGAETACEIYHCLKDHPNLQFVDLGMYKSTADLGELTNRICDEGIVWIAKFLQESKSLRVLSISCNGISNEGLDILWEDGVRLSSSLIHIDYVQYGLKIRRETRDAVESHLESNWIRMNAPQGSKKDFIRTVKHSPHVLFIDTLAR
jgi:hypothetical protein